MYLLSIFRFSKSTDTVNHKMFLSKLEPYRIRETPTDLFHNCLINGLNLLKQTKTVQIRFHLIMEYPKGQFLLGPLMFLIFINVLNGSVAFSMVYYFAYNINGVRAIAPRKIAPRLGLGLQLRLVLGGNFPRGQLS